MNWIVEIVENNHNNFIGRQFAVLLYNSYGETK